MIELVGPATFEKGERVGDVMGQGCTTNSSQRFFFFLVFSSVYFFFFLEICNLR